MNRDERTDQLPPNRESHDRTEDKWSFPGRLIWNAADWNWKIVYRQFQREKRRIKAPHPTHCFLSYYFKLWIISSLIAMGGRWGKYHTTSSWTFRIFPETIFTIFFTRWFSPGTLVSSTRKLISSSFHRLDMTLAVPEALNPNKPNHFHTFCLTYYTLWPYSISSNLYFHMH